MKIAIDRRAGDPPYGQVRFQIEAAIRLGELPVGARLPTVRGLADQLGVAPGTIARAYRELEAHGLVETRGRHGTFVSDPAEDRVRHRQELAELAAAYARAAAGLGIPADVATYLIDQAVRDQE